jgi:CubicO group peptidase (beta-lactamase class C family)
MACMKKILVVLLIALATPIVVSAQQEVDLDALDKYIAKWVDAFDLPGLAIGIVKGDSLIFSKGYGVRDVETQETVTPNTLFAIASCSKAFTAASLGMLVEDGKLDWDDKVVDYLPEFQLSDPYVTREITVRDLLCHRSGLATFDGDLLWYRTSHSREDVIRRIRHLPLKNGFREKFGYQNIMYIVASLVIEKVSGKTWDEYVQDYIFSPLGMSSTNTSIEAFIAEQDVAQPHINGKKIAPINWDNSAGAAAINSNIIDMSKWMGMWLNDGTFNSYEMMSQKTKRMLWQAHLPLPVGSFDRVNGTRFKAYGLGWNLKDYSGKLVVEHSGGLPGYISKVVLVPEEDLGIVILTNDMTWLPGALAYKVLDTYLNEKKRDWAAEYLEYFKANTERDAADKIEKDKEREEDTKPSLKFKDEYAGTFEDKMYGSAKIVSKDNTLTLALLPTGDAFTATLEHWHYDTFRFKFKDEFLPEGFLTFQFNSHGKVTGFDIDLPNPDLHFTNLHFTKK